MTMRKPYAAPLSGQIIRTAVNALRLESEVLNRRTARRYFSGEPVTAFTKHEIFDAIGKELVELGIIPPSPFLEQHEIPMARVISTVLALYADQWDHLVGHMRSASASVDRTDMAAVSYLRLAVVDLALRASALYMLSEQPTPGEGAPLWSTDKGFAEYLRQLLVHCGESRPTRKRLAEDAGVSEHTVDNWLDSKALPQRANIESIAKALSGRFGFPVDALSSEIHLQFTLNSVCSLLADRVGRETVEYLAAALMRFISRNIAGLREFSKLPYGDAMQRQCFILLLGAQFVASPHLLNWLWRHEHDPVWRTDLMAASKPWNLRLAHIAQYLGGHDKVVKRVREEYGIPEGAALKMLDNVLHSIQADPTRLPPDLSGTTILRIKGDAVYSAQNRMIQYLQARSEGDLATAIAHIRRAVELQPENPEYHFHLGATLGMAGDAEEGIRECWIASTLNPDWELPCVEVGIILLNARRDHEAHRHFEDLASNSEAVSPHLALNLGVARLRASDPHGGLDALEHVISLDPDNAIALDVAAHCAFLTGDRTKGRRLAKRAAQFGYDESYTEWVVKKKRPGEHHLA